MRLFLICVLCCSVFLCLPSLVRANELPWWPIQSIDTMKYSRDLAKEMLDFPHKYDAQMSTQVKDITGVGATHIAIATPYDEAFVPILTQWVNLARQNGLKVWFRGNFAGWEGWFGYARIGREEHQRMLQDFLQKHSDLFEEGDIFSACPECENGGPGDPRLTGDVKGHREFLIAEYNLTRNFFHRLGKNVNSAVHSMNGDVAKIIMDETTTQQLGGIVTIDHYVADPDQLAQDVKEIARVSSGKVLLGEFGAPIPDLHGKMTEEEQKKWIDQSLSRLTLVPELIGINYWVNIGGSTSLWHDGGSPKKGVEVMRHFFSPPAASGRVWGRNNSPLKGVTVKTPWQSTRTDSAGKFVLPLSSQDTEITIYAKGYITQNLLISPNGTEGLDIRLEKGNYSLIEQFVLFLQGLLARPQ